MHMKYECEPYMSPSSTYTRDIFYQESTDWTIRCIPSVVYPPFTNHQEKELFFYCFEHLYTKDIMSQEQLFIFPANITLEENFFLPSI